MVISVCGGVKAAVANIHLKLFEQCWGGERVAWRGK